VADEGVKGCERTWMKETPRERERERQRRKQRTTEEGEQRGMREKGGGKGFALAPYGCWVPLSINLWSTCKYLRIRARTRGFYLSLPLPYGSQSGYLGGHEMREEHARIYSRMRGRRAP